MIKNELEQPITMQELKKSLNKLKNSSAPGGDGFNAKFYKTADISQMVVCKEGKPDSTNTEDLNPQKATKYDPNKVDKKYLFPQSLETYNVLRLISIP